MIFDRILAVSDIHGEHEKFLKLLKKTEYNPAYDLLVICGDMIDRGTNNIDTIKTCQKLQQLGTIILKGNHEQFAQECLQDMIIERPSEALQLWVCHNGGATTYDELINLSKSELKELLSFFRRLPLYFKINDYIFVHAGADTTKSIEENSENDIIWTDDYFPFRQAYKDKIMIFGHTPTWLLRPYSKKSKKGNAKIWFDAEYKDKIGIDCGSVFGGRLVAVELPSYREFYI